MQWTCLSKKRHPPICLGPWRMIHYVALAYPTVPDHQQQQDYKTSSRAYRKSSRVRNVAIIWPSICEKRLSLFLCPKANILSSTGPSTFTIGSTQTVENRPMIRKSLGPSTNTGTDVRVSVRICCSCAPSSSLSYASYCS
jgi:hypothetical protein